MRTVVAAIIMKMTVVMFGGPFVESTVRATVVVVVVVICKVSSSVTQPPKELSVPLRKPWGSPRRDSSPVAWRKLANAEGSAVEQRAPCKPGRKQKPMIN